MRNEVRILAAPGIEARGARLRRIPGNQSALEKLAHDHDGPLKVLRRVVDAEFVLDVGANSPKTDPVVFREAY